MSTDFSQDPQENPYASPEAESMAGAEGVAGVTPRRTSMDYIQAYTYIFEHPKWVVTVLLLGLLQIVPILGLLVLYGYAFEVVAVLAYGRAQYPEFNFDRFGPYLLRGLWVVLTMICYQLIVVGVYVLTIILGAIATAVAGDTIGGLVVVMGLFLYFVTSIGIAFVMVPALIRVGLTNEISEGFRFDWIKDFVSKMWLEQILAGLFLAITSWLLGFVGTLLLCVGLLFAMVIIAMASGHICFQLYQIYLSRGGQPVAISTK
ncbi:MAG: DUF4013 domain-containing protein [Pirellulaceae bacterium]